MMKPLQLLDYMQGFRFEARCKNCDYTWYMTPEEIVRLAGDDDEPKYWYLDEAAKRVKCKRRCGGGIRLTPLQQRGRHNFKAGMP